MQKKYFLISIVLSLMIFLISLPVYGQTEIKISILKGSSNPGCELVDFCYSSSELTVKQGDTVLWVNEDDSVHMITSGDPINGPDEKFDSGLFGPQGTFSIEFKTPGTYNYFDLVHPWMEGTVIVESFGQTQQPTQPGGGCLIATATFGSELAPQVQSLRVLRDNVVMETDSGKSFMNSFNQFYYSFSPTIADWERQNETFREAVKLTITPMLMSLSLLQDDYINSEAEMLGYGISIIFMNIGMYFIIPAVVIFKLKKLFH